MKGFSLPVLVGGGVFIAALQVAGMNGWLPDLLAPTPEAPATPPAAPDDLLCGPKSLHVAMNLLGHPVGPGDVAGACEIGPSGVAFGDLAAFAESRGFTASLRTMNWDDLLASESVSILFVDPAHYLTVDARPAARPDGRIDCHDPGRVVRRIDRKSLERRWRGEALVLEPPTAAGGVTFDSLWNDAGFASADEQPFRIRMTNQGDTPCTVKVRDTSCHCTTASVSSETLAPGEEAFLEASIALKDRRGRFEEKVTVSCGPDATPVDVWLSGGRYADALCRTNEFVGELAAGEEFRKAIVVHDPGDESLDLSQRDFTARLDAAEGGVPVPCLVSVEKIQATDPAVSSLSLYPVKAGDFRVTLSGKVPEGCRPGPLRGRLEVSTPLPPPLDAAAVELSGRVVSRLRSEPPALLFGGPSAEHRAALAIHDPRGEPPGLVAYEFTGADVEAEVLPSRRTAQGSAENRPRALLLDLTFRDSGPTPARGASTLTVKTTAGDVTVPVLFGQRPDRADEERSPLTRK